jgi:hypothetical protein
MKHVIFLLGMLFSAGAFAQVPDSILTDVKTICADIDSMRTKEQWQLKNEQLTVLKEKHPDHWLTNYYAAYGAVQMTYYEGTPAEVRDMYLDMADALLPTIENSCPLKDEVHVLKAMIANARLAIDPMKRNQQYSPIFEENLKAAKAINENNPHIYLLKGFALYYTPKMFGGGAKAALPYFEKSKEKFALMTNRTLDVPHWGEPAAIWMIGECTKK